jgi:hypothetical protein
MLERIVGRSNDVVTLRDARRFDSVTLAQNIGVELDFFAAKVREF